VSTILAVSVLLVAVSGVAAWIAVGGLARATMRALERTEGGVVTARELTVSAAASAAEAEKLVVVVADGLHNTASALGAAQQISINIRKVLGFLDFIGSVDDLKNSLKDAEAELAKVQGSLKDGAATLTEAVPVIHQTVVALEAIPAELDKVITDAASARNKVDDQVWLWRLAIVAGCLALMGGLWSIRLLVVDREARPDLASAIEASAGD
jgi:hypothetical protein